MARYVLGIDGGGTRTRAVIMDENGSLCGSGRGGPSKYDDIGVDAAKENIQAAVEIARRQAGMEPEPFTAAFLGLGGVASDADREILRGIANDLYLAPVSQIGVDHDLRIALAGGLSGRPGIVQIAGTGSSCYGRNASGAYWRSGGWGPLIADEGSGYWLGIQAMKAATESYDGRRKPTVLVNAVLQHLELAAMDEIMFRLYGREMTRSEIALMGPLVIEAARAGDETALGIIAYGAQSMAECVLAVARQLGFTAHCELALTGGVFQAGEVVIEPFCMAVQQRLAYCTITLAELPPVVGACLLALEQLGITLPPEKMESLRREANAA